MNNAFIPLANLASGQSGTVKFRLTDNANVYVGGNFWGGTNDYDRSYTLGEDEYQLYQYYGGNSQFSSNEWWSAMSVKTYMEISGNAKVIARGGNSGLGWDKNTTGSLLEIQGGTLQVDSDAFHVGHDSSGEEGTANVQQTGGTATYKVLNIRHANSGYYLSGANSVMTAGSIATVANSTLSVAAGTLNVGTDGISGA